MLTVGSLFSGCGCGDLGLEWAGFEHKWFCEVDDYARKVLELRFPGNPVYGDIKEVDFNSVEKVDVLIGGFPCQDISIAGKGKGITGEKSSLWKEYWRGISVLRPRYAIIENSPMLVDKGLDVILSDLAQIGYNAEWCCLSAGSFGAIHERERIWIVAYPNYLRKRGERFGERQVQRIAKVQRFENIRSIENLQRRPNVPRPYIRRVDDAPTNWVDRLKCVGNGHFTGCTYFIGKCILRAEWMI